MATLFELSRVVGVGAPCCAACEKGAGACSCQDTIDAKPVGLDAGVGADTPVVVDTSSKSSGPGFFTGLVVGVFVSGAAATLLYVGLKDEAQRRSTLAARRRVGYAY